MQKMIKKIIKNINKGKSFLITSHVKLDGDALGSELALFSMLKSLKKKTVVYNQDVTPQHYRFLPGAQEIVNELDDVSRYDTAFILDCSELERIGDKVTEFTKIKTLINIDHHVSNNGFSALKIWDGQASSTGELLFRLFKKMDCKMTKDICTNLYAAILTDTGGFRYSSTSKDTLRIAGKLVENGADPQWISENIYESESPAKLKLLAKALNTLSLDLKNKIGSLVVTQSMLKDADASYEHTEGFVDIPRSTKGISISILYTQLANDYFKLSLRSKGKADVEKIAKKFGGGGHVNAAACQIKGNIETIRQEILKAVKETQ
jgi:bifunctional oligoribonuclease and PAP phosphatase NrnA